MLSACSTWPMLVQLFSTAWKREREPASPMLMYLFRPFDSLPCITILLLLHFFPSSPLLGCAFKTFGLGNFWQCVGVCSFLTTNVLYCCCCWIVRFACVHSAIILFSFFNFEMITIIYRRPSLKSNLHQSSALRNGIYSYARFYSHTHTQWTHSNAIICSFVPLFIRVLKFCAHFFPLILSLSLGM